MAIEFVPIHEAMDSLINESVASVLDVLPDESPVAERMWARVQAIREGDYPAACDLLLKDGEGVGWSGWFPLWTNPYAAWSSATYLAPSLRGTGLLPVLRCRQAHAVADICAALDHEVEFVSSIDTANVQSLRASHKYAVANGWRNRWYLRDDRENDRMSLRMEWPSRPVPHQCFLGQDLKLFEEPIQELDIEMVEEQTDPDLNLMVDTWVRHKTELSEERFAENQESDL